eukprot:12899278-Prorocentrum_lima.AAC.1
MSFFQRLFLEPRTEETGSQPLLQQGDRFTMTSPSYDDMEAKYDKYMADPSQGNLKKILEEAEEVLMGHKYY